MRLVKLCEIRIGVNVLRVKFFACGDGDHWEVMNRCIFNLKHRIFCGMLFARCSSIIFFLPERSIALLSGDVLNENSSVL